MTIEELNKLIQEELKAYLNEEQTDEAYMEDGDDDIEVTTDEPEAKDDEALDTLRQIFNMLKPIVEPEGDEEPEMDMDSDEGEEDMGDEADEDMNEGKDDEKDEDMKEGKDDEKDEDMKEGKDDEKDEDMKEGTNSLNESFDQLARFKKLANIKG